ncbi:unnamed protein product [marine sediment metagenome]|uniref:Uncharacterized protein n=1 Tax=marine sediment metagenome TaxID=412755 RepID=X1B4V3_9ZZZZ
MQIEREACSGMRDYLAHERNRFAYKQLVRQYENALGTKQLLIILNQCVVFKMF